MIAQIMGTEYEIQFPHSLYDDVIELFEIPKDNIADFSGKTIWYFGYLLGNEELFQKIIKNIDTFILREWGLSCVKDFITFIYENNVEWVVVS